MSLQAAAGSEAPASLPCAAWCRLACRSLGQVQVVESCVTRQAHLQGFDMVLPLVARDADGDDVRIFVHDVDVSHGLYAGKTDWYRAPGGVYNSDFFEAKQVFTPEHCGVFQGYGAQRVGDNSGQLDLSPSANETQIPPPKQYVVKSVSGGYRGGIVYKKQPRLEVRYSPSAAAGNGIDVASAQNLSCVRRDEAASSTLACREKLANIDQVRPASAFAAPRAAPLSCARAPALPPAPTHPGASGAWLSVTK